MFICIFYIILSFYSFLAQSNYLKTIKKIKCITDVNKNFTMFNEIGINSICKNMKKREKKRKKELILS